MDSRAIQHSSCTSRPGPSTMKHSMATNSGAGTSGRKEALNLSGGSKVTLRPHSTPATLLWLEENYEIAEGVCVPRNTLYLHYVDFCSKHGMQPVNAASFGKIIRQQFPQLTTRRLGTRGQSRYHYYGIAIRETSQYYELMYSKNSLQSNVDIKKEHRAGSVYYTPYTTGIHRAGMRCHSRLPDFPSLRDLCLPAGAPEERVSTFTLMYRAHCQRLLDTIIRASFDEVQTCLIHFWRGIPHHLVGILNSNVVINLVGTCDAILYKSVCSVLLPSILRALPEGLVVAIRNFAFTLSSWIRAATENLPVTLQELKIDLAKQFSHLLKRQTMIHQLSQAIRFTLHANEVVLQLAYDWRKLDMASLSRQSLQAFSPSQAQIDFLANLCNEFHTLLRDHTSVESFAEWLETVVDRCVIQPATAIQSYNRGTPMRKSSRRFLRGWSALLSRISREMSVISPQSFPSYHILHLFASDYICYLIGYIDLDDRARRLLHNIALDLPPEYVEDDFEVLLFRIGSDVQETVSSVDAEASPRSTFEPFLAPCNTQTGASSNCETEECNVNPMSCYATSENSSVFLSYEYETKAFKDGSVRNYSYPAIAQYPVTVTACPSHPTGLARSDFEYNTYYRRSDYVEGQAYSPSCYSDSSSTNQISYHNDYYGHYEVHSYESTNVQLPSSTESKEKELSSEQITTTEV
ncbi:transcription factor RFX4-like isoform X2 [Artemia franciscana]|uniref:DNA-binding protein RFX6 n=2 Tax=Artemia franciscana TaxID=6661 RepID=A0AA88L0Z9_ARTSF|nr:hypothetical protein QYM36_013134 [Artemia franciscana]